MAGMIKLPSRSVSLRGRAARPKGCKAVSAFAPHGMIGRTGPPDSTQPGTRRIAKSPGTSVAKPLRVMVADDDHRVLDNVGALLAGAGMKVCRVDNPYEIRSRVGTFKPEVLVLDEYFVTSGVDFRSVMSHVVQSYPKLKVIVTTGGRAGKQAAGAPSVWGASELPSGGGVPDSQELLRVVREAAPR